MTTSPPRSVRPAMSAYGVPDDLDGVLPWSWAEERLVACRNFWVVTASAAARPHAMPVWGLWQPETQRFTFSCARNSRKARNLAENPQVTVAVDQTVEVVSVEGRARFPEADELGATLRTFAEKYWDSPQEVTDGEAFFGENLVVEVTPERAFGIIEDEADFSRRATKWVW
jgi:nitroimidazol reductase NimA-like FMN-containing flavoprotein (pyridoxamine 5'-phosphate oxidase superfamily)